MSKLSPNKSANKPATPAAPKTYDATKLVNILTSTKERLETLQSSMDKARVSQVVDLQAALAGVAPCNAEAWDTLYKAETDEALKACGRYSEKSIPVMRSKIKTATIALTNGIKPDGKHLESFLVWVRPVLEKQGLATFKAGSGRRANERTTTRDPNDGHAPVSNASMEAAKAAMLAAGGDEALKAVGTTQYRGALALVCEGSMPRMKALAHIMHTPATREAFDAWLADMLMEESLHEGLKPEAKAELRKVAMGLMPATPGVVIEKATEKPATAAPSGQGAAQDAPTVPVITTRQRRVRVNVHGVA